MPVAKTYANMKIEGEPFEENKRMYVNVHANKGLKKVRWYTETEYRRMYPESEVKNNDVMDFNAQYVFGFGDLGYITIYRGDEKILEECVENHHKTFRRNLTFGYYTPSSIDLCPLPDGIVPIRLKWESVMSHDDRMKPHDEVMKIIASLTGNKTVSKYQGEINEWLQKVVKIVKKTSKENHFGMKYTYNLVDDEGNTYIWETGAKDYENGKTISLKMKVKEHKEIDGNEITVVWYCKEV